MFDWNAQDWRAWEWFERLTDLWRGGVTPTYRGLDGLRAELERLGASFTVRQGGGRVDSEYPFKNPERDFVTVPGCMKWDILHASVIDDDRDAFLALAMVTYPGDIDQYEPYGLRGWTMVPHQLGLIEAGFELCKTNGIYLPEGWTSQKIPKRLRSPDQGLQLEMDI